MFFFATACTQGSSYTKNMAILLQSCILCELWATTASLAAILKFEGKEIYINFTSEGAWLNWSIKFDQRVIHRLAIAYHLDKAMSHLY